jgi:hypothetical protein
MTLSEEGESKSVFSTLTLTCKGKENIYLAPTVFSIKEIDAILENYPGFVARIDYSENDEWTNLIFLPKKAKNTTKTFVIEEVSSGEIPF